MSARLSVCLVATFFPPAGFGGDALHAQRLAAHLVRQGHRVRVVHNPSAFRMLGGAEGADLGTPDAVEVLELPSGRTAGAATALTHLVGRPLGYGAALDEATAGFDVVHFHNPSLLGGPGGLAAGGQQAVRLLTTHEHWLVCPTHTLFRNQREVCTRRTCWRCGVAYRRPPQLWRSTSLLEHRITALDAVLSPSRFTASLHAAAFPGARVEVMAHFAPAPADAEAAVPVTVPVPEGRPYFLFAGRLEPIKGAEALVRAFRAVRGADLVIAGDGSGREAVERLAAPDPSVHLLGWRPHREVLALAGGARALVVPSLGYETFGGVALEAMAMGTPVIVRNLGSLPELVEHGGGMAAATDDELAAAMQRFADDADLCGRLGDEARAVATSRYDDEAWFRRYFGLIAELADGRGLADLASRAGRAAVVAG